jgi:hypothetical protein
MKHQGWIETRVNKILIHRNLKKNIFSSIGSVSTGTINDFIKMNAFEKGERRET